MAKPKKHVSHRTMNAMLVGITRSNPDMQRISECNVSVDPALGSEDVDAQTPFDGSLNEVLFGEQYVQKTLVPRDEMDPQGDAQEDQHAEDSLPRLEPYSDDSASDKYGDENPAVESGDETVDETVRPSPTKMWTTRSKSRKPVISDPIICSDTEDNEARPQQRKRTYATITPLRAGGTSKYFRRNSNQFPSIASKTLAACKARAGKQGRK